MAGKNFLTGLITSMSLTHNCKDGIYSLFTLYGFDESAKSTCLYNTLGFGFRQQSCMR